MSLVTLTPNLEAKENEVKKATITTIENSILEFCEEKLKDLTIQIVRSKEELFFESLRVIERIYNFLVKKGSECDYNYNYQEKRISFSLSGQLLTITAS